MTTQVLGSTYVIGTRRVWERFVMKHNDRNGSRVLSFESALAPTASALTREIERLLAGQATAK